MLPLFYSHNSNNSNQSILSWSASKWRDKIAIDSIFFGEQCPNVYKQLTGVAVMFITIHLLEIFISLDVISSYWYAIDNKSIYLHLFKLYMVISLATENRTDS